MTDAPARLRAFGIEDRVRIQADSAFEAVPPGAEAYYDGWGFGTWRR